MTNYIPVSQTYIPEGMIDLGLGNPDFALLPLDMLRRAAETCFARNDTDFLQYGAEQGDGYFRLALAGFLGRDMVSEVDPDDLFVTNGISNALDLVCAHFTRPGDTIFVEEPTYFLALRIFEDHELRIVPIPTDEMDLFSKTWKKSWKTISQNSCTPSQPSRIPPGSRFLRKGAKTRAIKPGTRLSHHR
jgi:2-aminoadipate transaminase